MKNFERKDKNERRRVLLSKNNELSHSYRKEKLLQDTEAVQENGLGVVAKLGTLTRKQLRALIAIIVAACIVVPSCLFGIANLRGRAEDNELPRLEFGANNTYVVPQGAVLEEGSYLYNIDGDDYTYNLERDYTGGDVLTYNPTTHIITATHDSSNNTSLESINDYVRNIDDQSNPISITLSGEETLDPDKTYSYLYNGTYYIFSFKGSTIGRINGSYDYGNNLNAREHNLPVQNDDVTILIDKTTGAVSFSDTSSGYDRRTIYVEDSTLREGKVYLITLESEDDEYLLCYRTQDNGSDVNGAYGYNSKIDHTVFIPFAESITHTINTSLSDYYGVDHSPTTITQGKDVIDGTNPGIQEFCLDNTSILPEFQAVASNNSSYKYLQGYDLTTYSENKRLGSIYNKVFGLTLGDIVRYNRDTENEIYLYNVDPGTHQFRTNGSIISPSYNNYNFANGSIWKYEHGHLVNDVFDLTTNKYLHLSFPDEEADTTDISIVRAAEGNPNKLYRMEDVYVKRALPNISGYADSYERKEYSPSIISYTKSSQTVEGLKTKKTVSVYNNDDDLFHVKLEGYMTSRSLKLPQTDIVLVLDTSGRMDDVLYSRDYLNLKTQTIFKEVSLDDVPHDALYDGNNPNNGSQLSLQSWIPRTYTDNKYVEDPNSPGTYVYLAQEYKYKIQTNLKNNHYKYYFTSSTGATYETGWMDAMVLQSIGDWNGVGSLTFKRVGTANASNSVANVKIDSIYYRDQDEENANNALADTSTMSLYNYANSPSRGLYYKHTDGEYYQVSVTGLPEPNGVTVNGVQFFQEYKFEVTVDGTTYDVTYGNSQYGAKNSVFQGFKKYETDPETGKLVVNLNESLPSKSLYTIAATDSEKQVTRMDAMKEAMEDLLININLDTRIKGADTRVAITTFSNTTSEKIPYHLGDVDMNDTRKVDAMISDLYGYTATNATFNFGGLIKTKKARIDIGTQAANTEFQTNSPDGNKRYEVVFTAGVPTKSNDGSVDLSVANSAIANTYTAKTTYGANVYAVGLFDYADETHTHGDYFYYTLGYPWYPCSGEVGSTWGKSTAFQAFDAKDVDPIAADVTNRMLNYMSSNYGDASTSGLSTSALYNPGYLADPVTYFLSTHGKGYRINRNYTRSDNGYYYGISPVERTVDADSHESTDTSLTADELETRFREVFRFISEGLSSPLTELDSGTVLYDGITDYYDIEGMDASTLRAYAADFNTGNEIQVNDDITATLAKNKKSIEVTGFNYSEHYIGGSSPAKLVVEFDIRRTKDFIGGNRVPTNTANSAIIDSQGHLEEKFNIPAIDLELRKSSDIANDQSVYYSYEADLTKAFDLSDVNGKNNAYVDLVYEIYDSTDNTLIGTYTINHGETVGSWSDTNHPFNPNNDTILDSELNRMYPQITEDKTYVVKCTVKPWLEGTIDDQEIPDSDYPTAYVYVLKPHMSATDLRISAVQDVDVDALVSDNVTWKHDANANWPDAKNNNVPEPDAETFPPTLKYKLKDITAGHDGTEYDPFAEDGEGNVIGMSDIPITENTDFQIIDLTIPARVFDYEVRRWIVQDEEILDDEGNGTGEYEHSEYWGDVAGSVDRNAVSLAFDGNTPTAYYANDADLNGDSGKNPADVARPNGKFTILLSKPFTLKVQKEFKGDYAVAGPVTIQVKDADGTLVAQKSFAESDFTPLKSDIVEVDLETGKTLESGNYYTVSETGVDSEYYTVTYAGTSKENTLATNYNAQSDTTYTFKTDTKDDVVTVVVTNTWKTEKNPPITNVLENTKLNPFFIAAAIVAILGGTGTAYMVKRKKETEA